MNNSFLRIAIVFFFILCFQISFSQTKVDIISINYSTIGKSEFKDKIGEVSLSHFDINVVTTTLKLGSKTKINNLFYYRNTQYNFESFPLGAINLPSSFQEIKYTLLARHSFNTNWELLLIPKLSVRSDFKMKLNENDLFPSVAGIILKTSKKNDQIKWGLGVGYNNDLGRNSIIPIFAFNYVSDSMRFNAFFPNNANLTFTSMKKIEYGFGFTTDAILVHVNTLDSVEYIRTLNVHLNPTFSYNLASNFWLNLKAGVVMRRKYDLYNADFETPTSDYENKLKPTGFVQVGLSLRTKS